MPRNGGGSARLIGGLLAGPLLLGTVLVDGASRAGFDPWRHGVSQLTLGDGGWLIRIAFVACGILVLGFASAGRCAVDRGAPTWCPRLVGAVGVGLVIAGLAPIDPALGYPPGQPEEPTPVGGIHQIGGTLLFVGLVGAQVAWARRSAREARRRWAMYSAATAVLVAGTATAGGIVYRLVQRGLLDTGPAGLLELISFTLGFAWLSGLAWHLLRPPAATANRPCSNTAQICIATHSGGRARERVMPALVAG